MESKGKLITSHQLIYGSYRGIIPEIYELDKIEQRNDWHNENVLEHTFNVVSILEQLTYQWGELTQNIDEHTRGDILLLSGTLHDIGKAKTSVKTVHKISFPNHESVGADMAKPLLGRFSLSVNEETQVVNLIRYHCEIHELIKYDNWKDGLTELGKKVPLLEMTLLGLADTKASILGKNRPDDYRLRMRRYEMALEDYKLSK